MVSPLGMLTWKCYQPVQVGRWQGGNRNLSEVLDEVPDVGQGLVLQLRKVSPRVLHAEKS